MLVSKMLVFTSETDSACRCDLSPGKCWTEHGQWEWSFDRSNGNFIELLCSLSTQVMSGSFDISRQT